MFIIKTLEYGNEKVVELTTIEKMLAVMAHDQKIGLPYWVYQDDKELFRGNLNAVDLHSAPKERWILKVKKPNGDVSTEQFGNLVDLSGRVQFVDAAGDPWYVLDRQGKVVRKGNLDKLEQSEEESKVSLPVAVVTAQDEY